MCSFWRPVIAPPVLGPDRIHIWKASLLAEEGECFEMRLLLDDYERSRADRFKFDKHRRRFIVGRAVLRILLGRYLGASPEELTFQYSGHGKPSLSSAWAAESDSWPLAFNLSNSNELATYAFARNRRVGIDVEFLRAMPDALKLAQRFFTTVESEAIQKQGEGIEPAFFRTWTRKEAILKASGEGLSRPLNSFDVSQPDGPLTVSVPDGHGDPTLWRLEDLFPQEGYAGAVAADGGPYGIEQFEYCPSAWS